MAMANLCLVNPKVFPSADATARASGADDILAAAKVYQTLPEAIADCQLVLGTSARCRTISWPELSPRESAEKVIIHEPGNQVAILFGRENSGLKNHELDLCQYLLRIPCNSEYSSLNISAAVQVVCYELFVAAGLGQRAQGVGKGAAVVRGQAREFDAHARGGLLAGTPRDPGHAAARGRRLSPGHGDLQGQIFAHLEEEI